MVPKFGVVYAVYTTTDDRGRRGNLVGYCSTKVEADDFARDKGWWGGQGEVAEYPTIEVNGTLYVLLQRHPIDVDGHLAKEAADAILRKNTLAVLTDEQKRVLGLK